MTDEAAMRRALELGRGVLGRTSPNPPVGAVVLDAGGNVAGEGATAEPGGPHAEVTALREAGARAAGGTLVVTLEPCRHTGRTGPCTEAIRRAGVAHVRYAVADPTGPAGGGAAELAAAGIPCQGGSLAEEARSGALEAWLGAQRLGRPFVTWKYAATLDGRVAAADGSSRWITGEPAREEVHRLRDGADAVVVGIGTVLQDDPELTVRPDPGRQPLRVVVDSRHRTPPQARVRPARIATATPGGQVDLPALLAELQAEGVVSVLLEGGPTLAAGFLRAGLVDKVVGYVAPLLLGAGPALAGDLGVGSIGQARRLRLDDVTRVGDDVRLTLRSA